MAMTPTQEAPYVLAYGSREDLRSDEPVPGTTGSKGPAA
jgi:hypothetical protein